MYDDNYIQNLDWFEFEEFLWKVFKKKWYKIRVTKKTWDQWADLIIEKNNIATAVQAKRFTWSVWNKAVQEIVAGMKYHDCDDSMVVTNSYFTKSAYALAERNQVRLMDWKELRELIDSVF